MKTLALLIGIMLVSTNSFTETKSVDEIDFTVRAAGSNESLHLGESIEAVKNTAGEPTNIIVKKRPNEPDYVQYVYRGLTVGFFEDKRSVTLLRITGAEYMTAREIKVNDTIEAAKEKYGPNGYEWPKGIQYEPKDPNDKLGFYYLLTFWTEGNVIKEIDINRAP